VGSAPTGGARLKQVLQCARTGDIEIADVPPPQLLPGCVLVRIAASLVSAGTERAAAEFAGKNLLQKAKARPDLVRQVWNKAKRDGVVSAIDGIRARLEMPMILGYSSAGTVVGVGDGVTDVCVGDRVACAGAGYAVHAEIACVPRLLTAKIPLPTKLSSVPGESTVDSQAHFSSACTFEEAAFTTVGAVALHGIRVADVKLGDVVAVLGLGLLGQLTVQLLKAAGCRVLGMDLVPERSDLAFQLGAHASTSIASEFRDLCAAHSRHRGVDAVLITADTPSSTPVNLAAEIARDRGVVVAVGTVGMAIERKLYYEKELEFRISRSYGPGRYDTAYEQKGLDYPLGYVRWTEARNMEAFLELIAGGQLQLRPLITHRFPVEQAHRAYELITGNSKESFLGVLITYPERPDEQCVLSPRPIHVTKLSHETCPELRIGVLGAGNFAISTMLPAITRVAGVTLIGICSASGVHSQKAAEKFGFSYSTTDENAIVNDPGVSTVAIATRHHLHARQILAALRAGKHVFCEKPLCLNEDQLSEIVRCSASCPKQKIMLGFNRRFAASAARLKSFVQQIGDPLAMNYRVNAGYIPREHWVNDPEQGGGRILGEVCHFVDFLIFLAGSVPVELHAQTLPNQGQYSEDNLTVSLRFFNGSQGTISYLANGDRSFSKERLEVFGGGAVAVLDDFRRLELVRDGHRRVTRSLWRQDKGHAAAWKAFSRALETGSAAPIPFEEIVVSTLATMRIKDSIALGQVVPLDASAFLDSATE
jgi:predicted dehydrogenase/threonine dehydrogenase-like Zn-dependent dehydrogenase